LTPPPQAVIIAPALQVRCRFYQVTGKFLRSFCVALVTCVVLLLVDARSVTAAQPSGEVDAARRAGWDTVSILAQSMSAADARQFGNIHAWLKDFRAAGGVPGKRPPGAPVPTIDASRLGTGSPQFWGAYFEMTPGDSGAMLLHAGVLLAAGEVSRAAYVLIAARQNPAIDGEMRAALNSLLEFCTAALGKGAQQVAEAAKIHDAGSPGGAEKKLREALAAWPQNALADYELGLALVAQQYQRAGRKPPARARLSLHSDLDPAPAALDAYARARAHDPLLIRAYQGSEVQGIDVLMVLGKRIRPLWDQISRETEAKMDNTDLEALADALLECGIAELSLSVRQVLIGREGGYDEHDRRMVATALRSIAPVAADRVQKRLAAGKPTFIKIVLP
jgi:hypothetical protein